MYVFQSVCYFAQVQAVARNCLCHALQFGGTVIMLSCPKRCIFSGATFPGGSRRSRQEPGGARRSQEEVGGARRRQQELGGARRSQEGHKPLHHQRGVITEGRSSKGLDTWSYQEALDPRSKNSHVSTPGLPSPTSKKGWPVLCICLSQKLHFCCH